MPSPDPLDTLAARRAGRPKATGSLAPEKGKCGGQLSHTGTGPANPPRYCREWPLRGKTRCKLHGGTAQLGLASPAWRGDARGVPERIRTDYERLLQDPQMLSLEREISWSRALYRDLMARADDGAVVAPALFKALDGLRTAWRGFRRAAADGTGAAARAEASRALADAMDAVEAARAPAKAEAQVRKELRECAASVANLTDKQNRQVERLYNMITTERAMALRMAEHETFIEAMERHVADPAVRNAIRRDVAAGLDRLARPRQQLPPAQETA